MGIGHWLQNAPEELRPLEAALNDLGPNVWLAIMPGLGFPLNLNPDRLGAGSTKEELASCLTWPIAFHEDVANPWPCSPLDFMPNPDNPYATSPMEGGLPMQIFLDHSWPGNVRELRNAIERAVITCNDKLIQPKHLPVDLQYTGSSTPSIPVQLGKPIKEVEKEVILKTLTYMGGNKTRTASVLGITPKTLYNKLKTYGVM